MNWWRQQDTVVRALLIAILGVALLCACAVVALAGRPLLSPRQNAAGPVAVLVTPSAVPALERSEGTATPVAGGDEAAQTEPAATAIPLATILGQLVGTPAAKCTPPPCKLGEFPACPSGDCPGGCGSVCQPLLGGTPGLLATLAPLFSVATATPAAEMQPTNASAPAGACNEDLHLGDLAAEWGAGHPIIKLVQEHCLWVLDSFQADVTGDGVPDDIFNTSGAGCGSCSDQTVFVFVNGELAFEYAGSSVAVQVHDDHAGFDVVEASYLDTDPMCCPTNLQVTPVLWAQTGFIPQPSQVIANPNKQ